MRAWAAACCAAALAQAAPETYTVDPAHTFPAFEVDHLGISTQRGRFDRTSGRIVLDREARAGTIEIDIDSASVTTGNPKLDATLRADDFFDVEKHPRIRFRADTIEFKGNEPARALGTLTVLGVEKPVALELRRFACTTKPFFVRTTCGADAGATVSRAAFGLSRFASFIGDEVRIVIQVEAVKQESAAGAAAPGG